MVDFSAPSEVEVDVFFHRLHEFTRQQYGDVGVFHHISVAALNSDKFFNIRMIYTQGLHIGAAPAVLGNGIGVFAEQIHKAGRSARFAASAFNG